MNSMAIYSEISGEISKFLRAIEYDNIKFEDNLFFETEFQNPIDMIDIISIYIDNYEKFNIGVWISLDENIYISVTEDNLDKIIRYLYERYPY